MVVWHEDTSKTTKSLLHILAPPIYLFIDHTQTTPLHLFSPLVLWWSCGSCSCQFECQKWFRKQFSTLWRSSEALLRLSPRSDPESCFCYCENPVKVLQSILGVRNDIESRFHQCVGPVQLVHIGLCVRKYSEGSFHHCEACAHLFECHKDSEGIFHHCEDPVKLSASFFTPKLACTSFIRPQQW